MCIRDRVNYFLNRDWQFTYRVRYGRNIIQIMTYKDETAPDLYYTQPSNVGTVSYTHLDVYKRQIQYSEGWI